MGAVRMELVERVTLLGTVIARFYQHPEKGLETV
jgi:hypothetical protein